MEQMARSQGDAAGLSPGEALAVLDTLVSNAPIGITFLDTQLRYRLVNDALAAMNGIPAHEHIGRTVRDVVPDAADTAEPLMRSVIDSGRPATGLLLEAETPANPGVRCYWMESFYPIVHPDGETLGLAAIVIDVTEQKRSEAERERLLAEMRHANELKDEFLGILSHELRAPITTIMGASRVLAQWFDRLDTTTRQEVLNDLREQAERLHSVVDDLLALARAELGRMEIEDREPVNLSRVIQATVGALRSRKPAREVLLNLKPRTPLALGASAYVRQVLQNLLANADKYSPPDTPIEVTTRTEGGEAVVVSVLDRGPGIPADEMHKIFERFYRSRGTGARVPGMGLGLTVCKRLVEAMGGRVWAAPREGGGLEVSFSLSRYRRRASN